MFRSYEECLRAAILAARQSLEAGADPRDCERGIERNPLFKTFSHFGLPRAENRSGHELRCEVVRPSDPLPA